ncbi:class I SAM-dependent methyltransferase [Natronococcus occultus]|uniref:Methylase involved in ubiquinone/menaquinone biosynthesis n=1 Tax=Natronococcus occultus SP4 TaxID=694430 RepID=L0K012_9EURY|nr:class I SAM-dependent methyltransferase [Natronococcus occultus]AGB37458.1 methylase involved in ubiquinone/menaquinone biosynthesis [Natronococcus occultus SP4]
MGFHTFPMERADALDDPSRYRFCSREELLEMLAPTAEDVVADLGSGTGFYTDDVAPFAGTVYAVDVQSAMHDRYREAGAPENVEFVTSEVSALPFADDELDGAFSTMTHHEYASPPDAATPGDAIAELARVLRPNGRLVTVDWSADGNGEDGPDLAERYSLEDAVAQLEAGGFTVESARDRPETFALVAVR